MATTLQLSTHRPSCVPWVSPRRIVRHALENDLSSQGKYKLDGLFIKNPYVRVTALGIEVSQNTYKFEGLHESGLAARALVVSEGRTLPRRCPQARRDT